MVGEYSASETRSRPEFAVADGILQLENEPRGPIHRRWLRVRKMRGAEVAAGQHSFRIGSGGVEVFPRLETTLPRRVPTLDTRASFGLEKLDNAIGGGIPRGDSTLLIGPSGIGKTLLALRFIAAGLAAGRTVSPSLVPGERGAGQGKGSSGRVGVERPRRSST